MHVHDFWVRSLPSLSLLLSVDGSTESNEDEGDDLTQKSCTCMQKDHLLIDKRLRSLEHELARYKNKEKKRLKDKKKRCTKNSLKGDIPLAEISKSSLELPKEPKHDNTRQSEPRTDPNREGW